MVVGDARFFRLRSSQQDTTVSTAFFHKNADCGLSATMLPASSDARFMSRMQRLSSSWSGIGELIAETEYAALGLFLEPNGAQLSVLGD